MTQPKSCIICGERATCYLYGQYVCTQCRRLADDDEETSAGLLESVERIQARAELARRYPSLAKKIRESP